MDAFCSKFILFPFCLLILNAFKVYGYEDHCIRQYFDQNSFVCACNATDCRSLEPFSSVPSGYIFQWESSQKKYRLHRTDTAIANLPNQTDPDSMVVRVRLLPDDRRQKIIGFGGAVTDSSGYVLSSLPIHLRDHIMLDYFSPYGIDYSVLRVPIGGTDFSNRPYTYHDDRVGDFDLEWWALKPEDTYLKIPIIKRAKELKIGSIKLLGSAWSPPAWMKTNGRIDGSGFLKGLPGGPYYKTWAKYHVKFLQAYAAEGVNFWGLTTGNEPTCAIRESDYFFNCLGMTPEILRDFVKLDLGPVLREAGYGRERLELLVHDEIREFIYNYTDAVLSDPEAASFITGISFHWYKNGESDYYEELDRIRRKYPDYHLMATEAAEGYQRFSSKKAQLGNWTRAETYASDIIEDIQRGATGWLDWNLVLDTKGGPSWADNLTDGLILVDVDRRIYYRNPMFYSLGHFAKFIPPGSIYIGHEMAGGSNKVKLIALLDPSYQTVLVILNQDDNPVNLVIDNLIIEGPVTIRMDAHSIKTLVTPRTA